MPSRAAREPSPHDYFARWIAPDLNSGCWLWAGGAYNTGYGSCHFPGYSSRAHRLSWELHRGPIPEGMYVLHKCDTRRCVNPDHLFIGTHAENMQDMVAKGRAYNPRLWPAPNVCLAGHELAERDIGIDIRGRQYCRVCARARYAAYKRRRKEHFTPASPPGGHKPLPIPFPLDRRTKRGKG